MSKISVWIPAQVVATNEACPVGACLTMRGGYGCDDMGMGRMVCTYTCTISMTCAGN